MILRNYITVLIRTEVLTGLDYIIMHVEFQRKNICATINSYKSAIRVHSCRHNKVSEKFMNHMKYWSELQKRSSPESRLKQIWQEIRVCSLLQHVSMLLHSPERSNMRPPSAEDSKDERDKLTSFSHSTNRAFLVSLTSGLISKQSNFI